MRAIDLERAILTGRYPNRTEETRHMPTQIEMEAMRAQIAQAKAIHEQLPKITDALERIATALEQDITKDIATLDEHFMAVIEATKEPKE